MLFIAPSTLQLDLFAKLLTPAVVQSFVKGATTQALALSKLNVDCADNSLPPSQGLQLASGTSLGLSR